MNVPDYLAQARALGADYQLAINALVDDFRRVSPAEKAALVAAPIARGEWLEALIAAVVSYLCHEAEIPRPSWVDGITSPTPTFILPAKGFAMRTRLLLESPPPFRNRGIFVPENYLSRA
jgi:hypothetical protein